MLKPRLAVLSAVLPYPGHSGQQQRVSYKLRAFRESFHVTFITVEPGCRSQAIYKKLLPLCDEVVLLPSRYGPNRARKLRHRAIGLLHSMQTGLKFSNYLIGHVEFTPERIDSLLSSHDFDCAVFEYWHAVDCVPSFHAAGTPCILDMHNVLWQSYARQLGARRLPQLWRGRAISLYRDHEEAAWTQFDGLITINSAEHAYVESRLPYMPLFYAPMGTDLATWPYSWQPVHPPRIAYYGGLGSPHNQRDARHCYEAIMPHIWARIPEAELWLVGSKPPLSVRALAAHDRRVHVTGYVANVQDVLKTMSLVLCPWSGRYGFRSRLVEVMALGVPVIATSDAVYGMNLEPQAGIFLADNDQKMARLALALLCNSDALEQQSRLARHQIEAKYSYETTYAKLATDLLNFTQRHHALEEKDV